MAKKLDLEATGDDLTALWKTLDGVRATSTTAKVDKAVLTRLLLDHGRLIEAISKGH